MMPFLLIAWGPHNLTDAAHCQSALVRLDAATLTAIRELRGGEVAIAASPATVEWGRPEISEVFEGLLEDLMVADADFGPFWTHPVDRSLIEIGLAGLSFSATIGDQRVFTPTIPWPDFDRVAKLRTA